MPSSTWHGRALLAVGPGHGRRPWTAGRRGRDRRLPGGRPRVSARARPGRRGPSRLSRRLRLRPGLLGVGDAGPGCDRRPPRPPPPRPGPGVLPGRQHLLAGQRRPLQVALRRRLRAPDPRVQGPRGPGQSRREGLPRGRGVRALGVLPAGAPDVAGGGPQGSLHASGPRGGRGGGEGGGRHRGGKRRRAGGGGDPDPPRQLPARRRHRLRGGAARARRPATPRAALSHAQFGFGSVEKGDPPAHLRQRYYSILWPLPKLTRAGEVADPAAGPPTRPLVDVMVLDSNTLDVDGGMLGERDGRRREDELQLLWLRNAMSQWLPAPGETHRIWKFVAMHHPPYTPRSCACRIFGKCLGGHGDETGLREQLEQDARGPGAPRPRVHRPQPHLRPKPPPRPRRASPSPPARAASAISSRAGAARPSMPSRERTRAFRRP